MKFPIVERLRSQMGNAKREDMRDYERLAADAIGCILELRQALIGGVELVKAGRDMTEWAKANERLLARNT
jgi:hypothetical protein